MDRNEKIIAVATVAVAAGSAALFALASKKDNKFTRALTKHNIIKTVATNANTLTA